MIKFSKTVFNHFINNNTFQKGASLAYYTVFSILPIIIIISSVLGLVFGEKAFSGELYLELKNSLGSSAANQIQNLVKNQHINRNSIFTTIIGVVTLVLSASSMFNQIHSALNNIWSIKVKSKNGILRYILKHFTAFTTLILVFLIIIISTSLNSFLTLHSNALHHDYSYFHIYEHLISIGVLSIVFAILFKTLGDAIVPWKIAALGGIFTAILFIIGKIGIALYIGQSHINSTFGAASAIALLMIWVYYTSQIIFLGASFVQVLGAKMNLEIKPNKNAVKIKNIEVD